VPEANTKFVSQLEAVLEPAALIPLFGARTVSSHGRSCGCRNAAESRRKMHLEIAELYVLD
jgi:hypothetical protein